MGQFKGLLDRLKGKKLTENSSIPDDKQQESGEVRGWMKEVGLAEFHDLGVHPLNGEVVYLDRVRLVSGHVAYIYCKKSKIDKKDNPMLARLENLKDSLVNIQMGLI